MCKNSQSCVSSVAVSSGGCFLVYPLEGAIAQPELIYFSTSARRCKTVTVAVHTDTSILANITIHEHIADVNMISTCVKCKRYGCCAPHKLEAIIEAA